MRCSIACAVVLAAGLGSWRARAAGGPPEIFRWERLPDLPSAISGQFAGVSGGCLSRNSRTTDSCALIVAGGSYFPVPLLEGGRKVWVDTVFV
ncbi:MAG: hypothetical protein ACRD7E_20080, partial [Bryobacteraceae bacterium]